MFDFLLKYSPVVFKQGVLGFKYLPSVIFLLMGLILLVGLTWLAYKKTTLPVNRKLKTSLLILKILVLLILCVMVLQPFISVSTVVPRKSSVIVLVDDSGSMNIKDAGNRLSRKEYVQKLLGSKKTNGLLRKLAKNFKLQVYEFSSQVEPLVNMHSLNTGGSLTDLSAGLDFASQVAGHHAVAGIIMLTDGSDNSRNDPFESVSLLKSKKIPLYIVGVGDENIQDIELAKVSANHSVIENSVVELSSLIKKTGIKDGEVAVELREEGVIVKRKKVYLHGAATHMNLNFSPLKKGLVHYALTVHSQIDEPVKENNVKNFLVDNRAKRARILYVEGYPRAEFKYLRRAVDGDPGIDLVSLLRTGPDKFYRQGIKNKDELKDGYPTTKEELFAYDAIIFGSIEVEFFTDQEMVNTREFVSQRGGGFLMIGGGKAFAQGGYKNTELEKILPVELPPQKHDADTYPSTFREKYKLILTPEGKRIPILKLAQSESENNRIWDALPELEGYNLLGPAKPGATVLAVHPLSEFGNPKIILAKQQYGRGRTMVFATSSSWLWQMGLPHRDMSHERFWRQLLRWLALPSPKQIVCETDKETYAPQEKVTLKVDLRNKKYQTVDKANVKAKLKTPGGRILDVKFNWSSNGKVQYVGTYIPDELGTYSLELFAYSSKGDFLGKTETAFFVEKSTREFSNAQLQGMQLKRLAEISGGKYYFQDQANDLPDEISVKESSYSRISDYDLWDMPLLFLLVLSLLSVEWFIRRSKGLS